MTNLIVDIGNTLTKAAVFKNDASVFVMQQEFFSDKDFICLIKEYQVKNVIVSSVREYSHEVNINELRGINFYRFNHTLPIPVVNQYESPETLGADRLAGVIGAKKIFPDDEVLVIDAGTCITYDYINRENHYYGGSISPGLNMRLKAMHHFTQKLPEIPLEPSVLAFKSFYGKNTREALISGSVNGLLFEIEGYIHKYSSQNTKLKIILCGGDAAFFDTRLKNSIFANQILLEPNLVMIGLNTVVNYQHDKKNK